MEENRGELIAAAGEQGVVTAFLNGHPNPDGGNTWDASDGALRRLDVSYVEGAILWLQHYLPIDTTS